MPTILSIADVAKFAIGSLVQWTYNRRSRAGTIKDFKYGVWVVECIDDEKTYYLSAEALTPKTRVPTPLDPSGDGSFGGSDEWRNDRVKQQEDKMTFKEELALKLALKIYPSTGWDSLLESAKERLRSGVKTILEELQKVANNGRSMAETIDCILGEKEALLCAPPPGTEYDTCHWIAESGMRPRFAEWRPNGWLFAGVIDKIPPGLAHQRGFRYIGPVAFPGFSK